AALRLCLDGGVVLHGCLDDPVWGNPELMQAISDCRQLRGGGSIADLVPGLRAAYRLELPLLAHQRGPAATPAAGVSLGADKRVAHRWRVVIDGAGVALEVKARRWRSRRRALAQEEICAAPRILQRFCVPHGLCHAIKDSLGVLRAAELGYEHESGEYE